MNPDSGGRVVVFEGDGERLERQAELLAVAKNIEASDGPPRRDPLPGGALSFGDGAERPRGAGDDAADAVRYALEADETRAGTERRYGDSVSAADLRAVGEAPAPEPAAAGREKGGAFAGPRTAVSWAFGALRALRAFAARRRYEGWWR